MDTLILISAALLCWGFAARRYVFRQPAELPLREQERLASEHLYGRSR